MIRGTTLIEVERARQVAIEGYTPEHDDAHPGEMCQAAESYCWAARLAESGAPILSLPVPAEWPWEPEAWKPSTDPMANLVKAGALIAAELDRLARKRGLA